MCPCHRGALALLGLLSLALPAVAQDAPLVPFAPVGGNYGPAGTTAYSSSPGYGPTNSANGLTSVEGMVPFVDEQGRNVFFVDVRGLLSDTGHGGANLGGGYRFLNTEQNRIFGLNAYYDNRDTGAATFQQLGGGFESLGQLVDVRGNFYLPLQSRFRVVGDNLVNGGTASSTTVDTADPFFQGHNILFNEVTTLSSVRNRVRTYQEAFNAFEFEAGVPVPFLDRWLKAYGGVYDLEGPDSGQAVGVRGRLEARLNDAVDVSFSVQNDRIYNTTAMFQVAFRFGGGAWTRRPYDNIADRLLDRVERNTSVLIRERQAVVDTIETPIRVKIGQVVAVDPNTGKPVIVDHVASFAAAGGDGTFEHPFQTLGQLQAGSNPGDILFAWAGSTFNAQSISLQTNQRFLGEGIPHTFASQFGTTLLPRATTNTASPIITGNPGGAAVTLADGTEVAGFNFTNIPQTVILGSNVTGVTIDRNTLTNTGILGSSSIDLEYSNPGQYMALVTGNTVNLSNGTGIVINNFAGTTQATLNNNVVTNGSADGIDVTVFGGTMTLAMNGNTVSGNSGVGISLFRANIFGAPDFSATLTGNTISGNGKQGITAVDSHGSSFFVADAFRVDLFDNTTSANGGAGIALGSQSVDFGTAQILAHLVGNNFLGDNLGGGDAGGVDARTLSKSGGTSALSLFLANNTSTPANGAGFSLMNPSPTDTFTFQNGGGNVGTFSTTGTITMGTVPP